MHERILEFNETKGYTWIDLDIGPIRFALGHVITSFFGTTPF